MFKPRSQNSWDHVEEEHGEDLWIVSYADMVTLLFGFFVILYSFSTIDDKKFDQMSEKMAAAFNAKPDGKKDTAATLGINNQERQIRAFHLLIAMMNLGENTEEAVRKIERSYTDEKAAKGIEELARDRLGQDPSSVVKEIRSGNKDEDEIIDLVLPDHSLFAPGGYQLSKVAERKIRDLGVELSGVSDLATIEVIGHTDSSPPARGASYQNNFTLSSLRAGAVAEALLRGGVDPHKINVRGMGSLSPLLPERSASGAKIAENMAKNRRVNLVLKKKRHDR